MPNLATYQASAPIACTLASLGTSVGLVAGQSSAEVDNTVTGALDRPVTAKVKVGASVTINTAIECWLVPKLDDTNYFDVFDGTDKAVTVTSRAILTSYAKLLGYIAVDTTTANRVYEFTESISRVWGGVVPPAKYQLFFTHNTGGNLNASGHSVTEKPIGVSA